jgi:hypothetical protein
MKCNAIGMKYIPNLKINFFILLFLLFIQYYYIDCVSQKFREDVLRRNKKVDVVKIKVKNFMRLKFGGELLNFNLQNYTVCSNNNTINNTDNNSTITTTTTHTTMTMMDSLLNKNSTDNLTNSTPVYIADKVDSDIKKLDKKLEKLSEMIENFEKISNATSTLGVNLNNNKNLQMRRGKIISDSKSLFNISSILISSTLNNNTSAVTSETVIKLNDVK